MKIRNIISFSAIAACMSLLVSCDIDRQPLTSYAAEDFFSNESSAYMALIGCYHANITYGSEEYSPTDWWSYQGFIMLETGADNFWNRKGATTSANVMTSDTYTASSGAYTSNLWNYSYKKIARCNRFIELSDNFSGTLTEKMKIFRAEAQFLRATQYFYLASYFHDVPLVKSTLTMTEANTVSKTSRAEILKWVENEFEEAAAVLPGWASVEHGRACKQAALAFAGRTEMLQQKWSEAAKTYKSIIDLRENALAENYPDLFLPKTADALSENIFIARHDSDQCGSGFLYHYGPAMIGAWCSACVTARLVEKYEFLDGTPFSYSDPRYEPANIGANRDPRLSQTVYWNGRKFGTKTYECSPDIAKQGNDGVHASNQTSRSGYMMLKYIDPSYVDGGGDMKKYGLKMPVIRYAEVLLSYVEARMEAGELTSADWEYVNDIRKRSSMPRIEFSNTDTMRKQLRHERDIELALEGLRLWDLYRWGNICEVISGDFWGASFPGSPATIARNSGLGKVDPEGVDRWYIGERKYTTARPWFIPQNEVDINPNLQ